MSIGKNLEKLKERIALICKRVARDPQEITLIAISKKQPDARIREAAACGQQHFGENKVQELTRKLDSLGDSISAQWHMVGVLQTNKIKYLAARVDWIHSIDRLKALEEVERRAGGAGRIINVLIQLNISGENQKSGCDPEKLGELLSRARKLKWVKVRGLMGMASFTDDIDTVRSQFRLLRELRDLHRQGNDGATELEHLSMGMSGDYETAIEEGATMIRIGTAIFGERNNP